MLINQPISREAWRKLVAALKEATREASIPEYPQHEDRHLNSRYYR